VRAKVLKTLSRAALAMTVIAIPVGAWATPVAQAEFGPIQLISKSAKEQADEAVGTAISADGRYVVWAGKLGGKRGVFRTELATGSVVLVAELPFGWPVKANPSISADGRYIAFTTPRRLDPVDDTAEGSGDVYVADLASSPPTYELGSASDGSSTALLGGSTAARGAALSEDGRRLAFVNQHEVYVRELGTTKTILISAKRDPVTGMTSEPVPGGGAATGISGTAGRGSEGVASTEGAAISGDGSTIAWVGMHLSEQVPMLAGEEPVGHSDAYHEPLWRRVPGPTDEDPPTRRVLGGGDPLAPGCPPGGTLAEPACQGPFPEALKTRRRGVYGEWDGIGFGVEVPRLSRDGETVAVIADPEEINDLFVVDMAPGLSRRQAVRRLTKATNPVPGATNEEGFESPTYLPISGPIEQCAISPEGNRIAFVTSRRIFPLAPPTLTTPASLASGEVEELYQVDRTGETIEQVTPVGSGAAKSESAGGPSYDGDGRLLAFSSGAPNLVAGDTNEKSDAFVVESPLPAAVDESAITRRPPALVVKPLWRITVDAASLPNGRVRVSVGVPGAGTVRVHATARLGRGLRQHRVASGVRSAAAAGLQRLELVLHGRPRKLAHEKAGLYAQLEVGFVGPGGKPLKAELDAKFLVHPKKVKGGKKKGAKR
jgi:Tol biopolymer transport system component